MSLSGAHPRLVVIPECLYRESIPAFVRKGTWYLFGVHQSNDWAPEYPAPAWVRAVSVQSMLMEF